MAFKIAKLDKFRRMEGLVYDNPMIKLTLG